MKHYAITGNMGSGKSTVCMIFEQLGISVFYADQQAHTAYELPQIKAQLINLFGEQIYQPDNQINKAMLASLIFNDPEKLQAVNQLIHPQVYIMYEQWKQQKFANPYTLYEAAILFESGLPHTFDAVILVTAPEELRLQRVMKYRKLSKTQALARMNQQWPEEKKIPLSNYIIRNDETQLLMPQILKLHQALIKA
ncbi:MAG: dephospho-CoA kinase [Bacteroidales bacterium]|jgi:dephospho-CoA kinase|nr:dephospho-CoA kinase [Bacteroidales bacterium]MDD3700279.1 dephospho-CoA kinase [Bacteroidales bacterium]MDY0368509.1 dephospho-CoA kinase [Bacteroidales bacterium]